MKIQSITFETIKKIWSVKLWPDRKSPIKPLSSIKLGGGYDMEIYNFIPRFWGVFYNEELIGVNSGFQTGNGYYRSRGIWVDTNYRRQNIASCLMKEVEKAALQEKSHTLWSMPRHTAIEFYESFGYRQISDWFDKDVEFGPNCFVIKVLNIESNDQSGQEQEKE